MVGYSTAWFDMDPAAVLLKRLCDDLLEVQLATRMFWADDQELRDDPFAAYVYELLHEASLLMGWRHVRLDVFESHK